jgi:hypothetical protein
LLPDAYDTAGEIAFRGPEMYESVFSLASNFKMERIEVSQPFAVFANLSAA